GHDVSVFGLGVRGEPAKAGPVFGAGTGLAQDLLFTEIETQAAGGAVFHGAGHTFCQVWNEWADIQLALYVRLEVDNVIGGSWVLKKKELTAVSNGGDQRAELQRRHGDAFTEAAHLTYAAELGCEFLIRKGAKLLALNVVSGKLTETELVRVFTDL